MNDQATSAVKKIPVLSNKRKAALFDSFCSTLIIKCMGVEYVVDFLRGGSPDLYSTGVDAEDIMRDLFEQLEGEEFLLVLQNNLAMHLQEDLRAKKVTIKW